MSPEAVRTYQEPVCNSFDGFWKAYPKKRGRQDALKAWAKLNPDEATSADRATGASRCQHARLAQGGRPVHPAAGNVP